MALAFRQSLPRPTPPATGSPASFLLGAALALVTVTIWALWIVSTRQAMTHAMPIAWLGLMRYAVPALLLLPFWWRRGLVPKGTDLRLTALVVIGSGAPFFVVVGNGMAYAPAAEIAVLLPGVMPVFVALLSGLLFGERFGHLRLLGFGLSVAALLLIGGAAVLGGEGFGRLLFPFGALLWAIYTVAFKRSGLTAVEAVGITGAWSAIGLLPFAAAEGIAPLMATDTGVLALQIVSQGFLSGVVALFCYSAAVARIGASQAAAFSALTPALAALLAVPMLGEWPAPTALVGIILSVVGVLLASGSIGYRPKS